MPAQQSSHVNHYATPQTYHGYQPTANRTGIPPGAGYNPPRAVEVYHLSDTANLSIPEDIREQFQRDEPGRVLFFTTPPLDTLPPYKKGAAIGHSAKYMAEKIRRAEALSEKRKREGVLELEEDAQRKKAKHEKDEVLTTEVADLTTKAINLLEKQITNSTKATYRQLYGDEWEAALETDVERLGNIQAATKARMIAIDEHEKRMKERKIIPLKRSGVFLDDLDPRY